MKQGVDGESSAVEVNRNQATAESPATFNWIAPLWQGKGNDRIAALRAQLAVAARADDDELLAADCVCHGSGLGAGRQ